MDRLEKTKSTRRGFLGMIGKALGAGVGLSVLSAGPAWAANTLCCRSTASNCPNCPGSDVKYKCANGCTGNNWCVCHQNVGDCYQQPCT